MAKVHPPWFTLAPLMANVQAPWIDVLGCSMPVRYLRTQSLIVLFALYRMELVLIKLFFVLNYLEK